MTTSLKEARFWVDQLAKVLWPVALRNLISYFFVLAAVIKYPDRSNLRKEEGLVLAHSLRIQSIMVGKTQQQEHEILVALHWQLASRRR